VRASKLRPVNFSARADELIAEDLGERMVKGETAAPVANYSQALSRIAQELNRLLRDGPVMAVWLFDQSASMTDDQAEIRASFQKIYEEIGLDPSADRQRSSKDRSRSEPLVSAIVGFAARVDPVLAKPTSDVAALRKAIEQLRVARGGREYTASALRTALEEYRGPAKRQKRRLAFIVVTDESGDDWDTLEPLIAELRANRSPVFVLGREAIFGYPYVHTRWVDGVYGLTHWLRLNRGPETALPECLQWDGLHGRWDAFSSGAGPYELARVSSETGGLYLVLPGDENTLEGPGAHEARNRAFLDLKEYQPALVPRAHYEAERSASRFRSTVWNVIRTLNPHLDPELNLRELHYPADPAAFHDAAQQEARKALRAMGLLHQAVTLLDDAEPSRADEPSPRWRADYDLLRAQCLAYRVRLFQFLVALDQHDKQPARPLSPPNNCWNIVRRREMLAPDAQQVRATKVDLRELEAQERRARAQFELVLKQHANTPWARRAQFELDSGFGMHFAEAFLDPRYREVGTTIKLPDL
jgi:hypothetical protein